MLMFEFFAPSNYWEALEPTPNFKMFGIGHIIVIFLMFAAIILLFLFGKRIDHAHIKKYLIVSAFVWGALDALKIILFFSMGDAFQGLREVLPLFLCSLFIYMLPLAAFGKGIFKTIGEYTLSTLCLLTGLLTTINCPALYSYPFLSFYGMHSVIYHAFMATTGVLLLTSGYVKPKINKFYYPMFVVSAIAIPAIIMNYAVNTDYMLMRYAWGTPVFVDIAKFIGEIAQIFFMLFTYTLISLAMTALAHGYNHLAKSKNQ